MIDITNEIYNKLKIDLPSVNIQTSYPIETPKFPLVTFEEIDNSTYRATKDTSGFNHSSIGFEVNIYTTGTSKMSSAKTIRNQIDSILSGFYGMPRTTSRPVPNFLDGNIYRYTMRYSGLIDKTKTIYRG